ncbi:hypothetical protein D3C83_137660 [compost metagenome]
MGRHLLVRKPLEAFQSDGGVANDFHRRALRCRVGSRVQLVALCEHEGGIKRQRGHTKKCNHRERRQNQDLTGFLI